MERMPSAEEIPAPLGLNCQMRRVITLQSGKNHRREEDLLSH